MLSRFYNLISKSYIAFGAVALVLVITGCEQKNKRTTGSLALKGELGVHTATPKTAYVLTSVKNTDLVNTYATATRNPYQRAETPTVKRNSGNTNSSFGGGTYGMISVISIYDSSDITTDSLGPGDVINYSYTLPDYNTGILGVPTSQFVPIDSINVNESFIDMLPDGSSLLVSSPDTGIMTQVFLTPDNGNIVLDNPNKLSFGAGIRPGRFTAANNFKNNPFVFVSTNKGIATLKCTTPTPYGPKCKIFGSIEPLMFPPSSNPTARGPRVLDIAISANDELVIASNQYKQVFYKTMEDVKQMEPYGVMDQKGYVPIKLESAPPNIIAPIPQDSVAALTAQGLAFVNSNDHPIMFEWNKLTRFKPVDIAFHPSGESVLILTDQYLFFGQLEFPITGLYLNNLKVPYGGAKEMDIDPRGKFAAVVASGSLSFFPMEEWGVVSPPDKPISGLPGDTIGVTLR